MKASCIIAGAFGLSVCVNLTGCVAPAASEQMTVADPVAPCPLAIRHPNSIMLSEVIGGEPTDPLKYSTVDNEGLETAISASLNHHGLLSVEGSDPLFELRVALAALIPSGPGFTTSVTAFIRYKLSEISTDTPIYDDVIEETSTLSSGDVFLGIERLQRANENAVHATILTFLFEICALEFDTGK